MEHCAGFAPTYRDRHASSSRWKDTYLLSATEFQLTVQNGVAFVRA